MMRCGEAGGVLAAAALASSPLSSQNFKPLASGFSFSITFDDLTLVLNGYW